MPPTVHDVAAAAGVSASTVSRALTIPDMVREGTRVRVLDAARQLGYVPNRAARGLITGRTGNLGLILPDLTNPFFPSVVKGVQAFARSSDYAVFIADADEDPAAELGLVKALSKQVDGLILCSPRMSERDLQAALDETRIVLLNRRLGSTPCVTFDNAGGVRQAIGHLVALAHRTIAWVGGPRTSWSNRERTRAVRAATTAAGIQLAAVGNFPPTFEGGVAAADQVVATGASAALAYNDLMALGLLSQLERRKIRVPEQFSVVGFDDIPMSAMASPALTTVSLPKDQAGRSAVELLLTLVDGTDPASTHRQLAATLVVRNSTGLVRQGRTSS